MTIKINRNRTLEEKLKIAAEFEANTLTPEEEKELDNAIRRGDYLNGIVLPDGTTTFMGR